MKLLLFACLALPAAAQVELHLTFGVLQKVVGAQVFTEDGRKYVKGSKDKRCSFAYLENPRVGEADGRLLVRARFSGRSALNVLGQCVGVGDSFDVVVRMTPYTDRSLLRLRDVEVTSDGKRGIYARAVCKALAETIPRVLVYDFAPDFKRALEADQPGVPFKKSVDNLSVQSMSVSKEALVLQLGLKLTLR
ncbi:MAG: hypothetical protein JNM66_21970 [Bryobacterales bacterium]|nr:hypothetical protein [Bryobacterales bacterium]